MKHASSTRESILALVEKKGSVTGPQIAEQLGITRQAVNLHLRELIAEGQVIKTGSTRAARYYPRKAAPVARSIKRMYPLAGLDEARVYAELALQLNFSRLPDNVETITNYAFTEILNNAIDHSMSDQCRVEMSLDASHVRFSVRDRGIGVFHSIADKFGLENEHAALIELVKGKTTTMPEAHSGEGIFFVSRSADRLSLRSHRLQIEWDRLHDEVFVSDQRFLKGTLVQFECSRHVRTRLEDIFDAYAPAEYDYRFEKTRVSVKLLKPDYVSRSEARRLLHNLDRFAEIELDLKDVRHVGQGFADEVFRVFTAVHPTIRIRAVNASKAVAAMISHVSATPPLK